MDPSSDKASKEMNGGKGEVVIKILKEKRFSATRARTPDGAYHGTRSRGTPKQEVK